MQSRPIFATYFTMLWSAYSGKKMPRFSDMPNYMQPTANSCRTKHGLCVCVLGTTVIDFCKNRWTYRDATKSVHLCVPKELCIRWGLDQPREAKILTCDSETPLICCITSRFVVTRPVPKLSSAIFSLLQMYQ